MKTSRRSMIKLGLCATASLVTSLEGLSGRVALAAVDTSASATDDGGWLRRDMFEAIVGERFAVLTTPSIELRLTSVEDVPSAPYAGTVNHPDCFTVSFRGPRSSKLAQGSYRVQSPTLGTFVLFLVPGPTTSSGIVYAATFNRVGA